MKVSTSAIRTNGLITKLTMSLVNDSSKFRMAVLQIHCYFLWRNNSVFAFEVNI